MIIRFRILLICLVLISSTVLAETPPDKLISQTVERLIVEMSERKLELENNRTQLYELVDRVIVKHIAVEKVAKLVLARHWRTASVDQRIRFSEAFKKLLIRTYASALFDYTGREEMSFRPLHLDGSERIVVVRTDVKLPGVRAIPVNYKFFRVDGSNWKIFDVTINGISLVTNYRASYSRIIKLEGLDGLIQRLEKKTAQLR